MYVKKQKTIKDVERNFVDSLLKKRSLKNVGVSNHFIDRIVDRRIDERLVMRGINKLADNINQIVVDFASKKKETSVQVDDFVIKISYLGNCRILLATCYQTSNRD